MLKPQYYINDLKTKHHDLS